MKVLMFGWEFPPYNSGGLGIACLGLTTALASEKINVLFVLPKKMNLNSGQIDFVFADEDPDNPRISFRSINSILTPYLTSENYYKTLDSSPTSQFYGNTLFAEVERYSKLATKVALENDYDVIHAHDWLTFGAAIRAHQLSGKPLVVHIHATEFDRGGGLGINQYVYDIEKRGMEVAQRVIAVSAYTKGILVDKYGIPAEKIEVVHNGINLDEYQHKGKAKNSLIEKIKRKGGKIVLFVGRLTIQKGPEYFLYAAKQVIDFDPSVTFVIAGSGDMEQRLHQMVKELGIAENVVFTGFIRGEELSGVYSQADVFVMSSVSEPFGLVPLEAVTNNVPVIVSKQSGVAEVLDHSLKVDFWDVEEMANLILGVLSYPEIKHPMTKNGYKEASTLTWKKAAGAVKNIYGELLRSLKT